MGLDMYLEKEKYFSKFRKNMPKVKNFEECESMTISGVAMYWRKANAIHGWFVKTVQKGVDECQRSYVTFEQLQELLGVVTEALNNKDEAGKLLPPTEGFFFGSTDINEGFFDDLKATKEGLERILNAEDADSFEYYYRSSW